MKPSIGQIGKKSTYKQILLLENFLKEGKKDDNFIERILIEIEKLLEESRDFLSQK